MNGTPSDDRAVAITNRSMQMGVHHADLGGDLAGVCSLQRSADFLLHPQILRIAGDRNGASAISYPTWVLWTCANASTAAYAAMNLGEFT